MDETTTLQNILEAGKTEFLEKGFQNASLRKIAKNAGVTTGAFYGYFSSKEALFAALVEKHASAVLGRFMSAQDEFKELPEEEQPENLGAASGDCIEWTVDYIYKNFEAFKLIICCSEGTAYADFIHTMVEVDVESTYKFINVLRSLGYNVPDIDVQFCHMVASGMLGGMFEIVVHDMPKDKAVKYVAQLHSFYTAGWEKMFGMEWEGKNRK